MKQKTIDLSRVFQATIPGIWNQIRFDSFPVNWALLGFSSDEECPEALELHTYGSGGLSKALAHLKHDSVQYLALRVSVVNNHSPILGYGYIVPLFVFITWRGSSASIEQCQLANSGDPLLREYFFDTQLNIDLQSKASSPCSTSKQSGILTLSEQINVRLEVEMQILQWMLSQSSENKVQLPLLLIDNEFCTDVCYHYDNLEEDEVCPPVPGVHRESDSFGNFNSSTTKQSSGTKFEPETMATNSEEGHPIIEELEESEESDTESKLEQVDNSDVRTTSSFTSLLKTKNGDVPRTFNHELPESEWKVFQEEHEKQMSRNSVNKQKLKEKVLQRLAAKRLSLS